VALLPEPLYQLNAYRSTAHGLKKTAYLPVASPGIRYLPFVADLVAR